MSVAAYLFGPAIMLLIDNTDTGTEVEIVGWKSLKNYRTYHDYYEAKDYIENITTTFPEIAYLNSSIGRSFEGRDIFALKISDNPSQDENETKVLFHAQIHAREVITLENILALISHICNHYGIDSNITQLVDNREIWFIPVLNPDGALYCAYNDSNWRKNRRNNGDGTYGVDLNRNFDYKWGGIGSSGFSRSLVYRGVEAFSEPETRVLRDFVSNHNFSGAISMHSYSGLWLWPWAHKYVPTLVDEVYRAIAQEMQQLQPHYQYRTLSIAEFGRITGNAADWLYGRHSIFTYTVEIYKPAKDLYTFQSFNPPSRKVQYEVENNIPAFLYFINITDNPYAHIT